MCIDSELNGAQRNSPDAYGENENLLSRSVKWGFLVAVRNTRKSEWCKKKFITSIISSGNNNSKSHDNSNDDRRSSSLLALCNPTFYEKLSVFRIANRKKTTTQNNK